MNAAPMQKVEFDIQIAVVVPPDVARRVVAAKADIVRVVHAAVELSVREVMKGRAIGDGTLVNVGARVAIEGPAS